MAVTIDGVGEINGVVLPTTSFGKVLQVVRATNATQQDTSSGTFVDAGISVTITPQKTTSTVILIHACSYLLFMASAGEQRGRIQITDSSNTAVSGAEDCNLGGTKVGTTGGQVQFWGNMITIGYASPATLSAVTYKARFAVDTTSNQLRLRNNVATSQLYAIEVSA